MIFRITGRMLKEVRFNALCKFIYNFAWQGICAVQSFKKRLVRGERFPAFLFISITNRCNLKCQGCWVKTGKPHVDMPLEQIDGIIRQAKKKGVRFFGILGGEPLLHPNLYEIFHHHSDCYFQLFTNGLLLDESAAILLAECGNVTPLISIEGLSESGDIRRGGIGVYSSAVVAVRNCAAAGIVTGASTSVCKSNFDELVCERHLDELVNLGVHYAWYYIFRPVGENPCPELALNREEVRRLREFIVNMRPRKPIAIVDSYWDAEGNAICPAATGIAYHINPSGKIEPCPPVQFADVVADAESDFCDAITRSDFLPAFGECATADSRGCILMENPVALAECAEKCGAEDTSGYGLTERLLQSKILPSHDMTGQEVPEKHWLYRFAKKHWFFGFGAYG